MENEQNTGFGPRHPFYYEAQALAWSIVAIRKAQGKRNPSDFAPDSVGWSVATAEFLGDIGRFLEGAIDL